MILLFRAVERHLADHLGDHDLTSARPVLHPTAPERNTMPAPEPDGHQDTVTHPNPPVRAPRPAVDTSRPFGAHLRMKGWKPLVLLAVPPLVLVVLQVLLYLVVGLVEGSDDTPASTLTPLRLLAVNISVVASALLTALLLVRMTGAPWRSLISSPRAFDARRLAHYLVGAALLVGAGIGVMALVAPDSTGWTTFGITGTTLALLLVIVLTTPLQAAGEELIYRSAVLPAAASWVRAVRPALVVGLVVSGLAFAALHGSADPWLFGYYALFGVCAGLTAIISGGVEAPVALHVATNVLFFTAGSLMAGGGTFAVDRSVGSGDASVLIPAAAHVGMVVLVWVRERRGLHEQLARRPSSSPAANEDGSP